MRLSSEGSLSLSFKVSIMVSLIVGIQKLYQPIQDRFISPEYLKMISIIMAKTMPPLFIYFNKVDVVRDK